MNTKEVINNNKQKHLQIDGVTALFKDGEELGVVSGFDVVSGCWLWFDIVFLAVTVSMSTLQGQWEVDKVGVARVVVNDCKI